MDDPSTLIAQGLCIAVVLVVPLLAYLRHRSADLTEATRTVDPRTEETNDPLRRRAAAAVIALDDAVRSSAEEVACAEREHGTGMTETFRQTVESARATVDEAFHVLHELEEDQEQGTVLLAVERRRLEEVLALTAAADAELDAQEGAFAGLRDLHGRLPEMLASIRSRTDALAARVPEGEDTLAQLRTTYPEAVLVTPAQDLERVGYLVDDVRELVDEGEARLADGDRAAGVVSARAAEQALGQAEDLLTTVGAAGDVLREAESALGTALDSLDADVADAEELPALEGTPVLEEARAALAHARQEQDCGDVLGALARLERAEHHLDVALEPHRQRAREAEDAARTAALRRVAAPRPAGAGTDPVIERRVRHVRERINRASQMVTTRRGHLRHEARQQVSESLRLVGRAEGTEDPVEAADLLDRAEQLADRAYESAVDSFGYGKDRAEEEDVVLRVLLGLALGGIASGGSGGGGSGQRGGGFGGSSGGFGGGGSFGGGLGGGGRF